MKLGNTTGEAAKKTKLVLILGNTTGEGSLEQLSEDTFGRSSNSQHFNDFGRRPTICFRLFSDGVQKPTQRRFLTSPGFALAPALSLEPQRCLLLEQRAMALDSGPGPSPRI